MTIRKKVPTGLIGMIGLVVILEGWFARHEADFKISWHWEWAVNGRAATRKAADYPLICLGDSQVNHGVVSPILKYVTGSRTLNLALSGGQATTSYFQLRRVLESGAKPRAVLVDFFPLLLNHGYEENEARWPDYLSVREAAELAVAVRDQNFLARTVIAKLLPSVRERHGIRKGITAAFGGTFVTQRDETAAYRRNWSLNAGGLVFNRNPDWVLGDLEGWYKFAFCNPEWCKPYHAEFLEKFFALASAHDVPVFWLVPPLPPEVQAKFTEKGQDEKLDTLVADVLKRHSNVTVLDGRNSEYPHEVFMDPGHLDRIGARTFTVDIGEAINHAMAGDPSHWVHLPTYRTLPDDSLVEDLSQSRQVVTEALTQSRRIATEAVNQKMLR